MYSMKLLENIIQTHIKVQETFRIPNRHNQKRFFHITLYLNFQSSEQRETGKGWGHNSYISFQRNFYQNDVGFLRRNQQAISKKEVYSNEWQY